MKGRIVVRTNLFFYLTIPTTPHEYHCGGAPPGDRRGSPAKARAGARGSPPGARTDQTSAILGKRWRKCGQRLTEMTVKFIEVLQRIYRDAARSTNTFTRICSPAKDVQELFHLLLITSAARRSELQQARPDVRPVGAFLHAARGLVKVRG